MTPSTPEAVACAAQPRANASASDLVMSAAVLALAGRAVKGVPDRTVTPLLSARAADSKSSGMPPLRSTDGRVALRELRSDDWVHARLLDADPEVTRFQENDATTEADTRRYIDEAMAAAAAVPRRRFELAITLPPADDFVGRVALNVRRPEHREAELWYAVRRDHWGRGIATLACRTLLHFGFEQLDLHRVWADTDPRNAASIRLLEKLGFKREGLLRENYWLGGEWCDSLVFGLLETDR